MSAGEYQIHLRFLLYFYKEEKDYGKSTTND